MGPSAGGFPRQEETERGREEREERLHLCEDAQLKGPEALERTDRPRSGHSVASPGTSCQQKPGEAQKRETRTVAGGTTQPEEKRWGIYVRVRLSWSWSTPELTNDKERTDREDADRGDTETAFRMSGTTLGFGAEESRCENEDR
ncbi:hypothetical protein NDU88_000794 [Pleurodeles waltl]|uniref:Uncharacterized protein n=1 Tax=Pleurodeles waltl TaxID=8319 RepID=A0AAV7R734_PLEWA|nr:hypothetical protein NDU88_000794 [Pleurodeles waltl]